MPRRVVLIRVPYRGRSTSLESPSWVLRPIMDRGLSGPVQNRMSERGCSDLPTPKGSGAPNVRSSKQKKCAGSAAPIAPRGP